MISSFFSTCHKLPLVQIYGSSIDHAAVTCITFQQVYKEVVTRCCNGNFWKLKRKEGKEVGFTLIVTIFTVFVRSYFLSKFSCRSNISTAQNMEFYFKDFLSKCDQIRNGHIHWRNPWWKTSFLCSITSFLPFVCCRFWYYIFFDLFLQR